ncbi:O-antigen ligase family protein [Synechocystis sp. PCC 7339]|uniref:O-antigen ligase family protein n=1 Tax=Synechocystis sp. PCC 7339 TaxID=2782213 RepID=UPI001CBFFEDC|nr:O-antigen ligase family protein [Synechocystis sp. PCC 7339]UAJ73123.1 O-antigen ligase family protein [Synechocystis sp. PCC 7339]
MAADSPSTPVSPPSSTPPFSNPGRLLGLLMALLYGLFTLLPNGNSLLVSWPWVFVWQTWLWLTVLWCLWQIGLNKRLIFLGLGFDWLLLVLAISVAVGSITAQFPAQSHWYSWTLLAFWAGLYGLRGWLKIQPQPLVTIKKLLTLQGYVGFAFIIISLLLWFTQTLIPFWQSAAIAKEMGLTKTFSFGVLELQNWAPIGHQNYVAGYLVLILPLLSVLIWLNQGKKRWFWAMALALGLIDFYTTSSRGGLLGLAALLLLAIIGVGLLRRLPWLWWLGLSSMAIAVVGIFIGTNDRLLTSFTGIMEGQGAGQFAYRLINSEIGWRMGSAHPWTGIGLGNVPLQYQLYRPVWAGRESEFIYQLHSTPAQLFAELGVWGILIPSLFTIGLVWQLVRSLTSKNLIITKDNNVDSATVKILIWTLTSALLAYGITSWTDYQLDNVCISGIIIIYFACLLQLYSADPVIPKPNRFARPVFFAGITLLLVVAMWLFPILRAWQLSEVAFRALAAEKVPAFTQYLTQAENLAPWEAYYPTQLGWNLGNIALTTADAGEREELINRAIDAFERSIEASPHQEFIHNNLGWLALGQDPPQASQSFATASQLVPAKRGVFYGLGLSLLVQQKLDLAIEAFSLECLRDPLFITNPLWRNPNFALLYPPLMAKIQSTLSQLRQDHGDDGDYQKLLGQIQGGIHWWLGQFPQAEAELNQFGDRQAQAVVGLSRDPAQLEEYLPALGNVAAQVVQAWQNPARAGELINQAWLQVNGTPMPEPLLQQTLGSLQQAPEFYTWLTNYAPILQYRRQRLGFGVNSRHIDGPNPSDFYQVTENLALVTWFPFMLPSPILAPELDNALQPLRVELWDKII